MAKSLIPDPLTRRHLLEKDLDEAHAMKIAEAYLAEGRVDEAIDFLSKAGATDRLEALSSDAIASGDAFLVQSVVRLTGVAVGSEAWLRCAEKADELGKARYADVARRQASPSDHSSPRDACRRATSA